MLIQIIVCPCKLKSPKEYTTNATKMEQSTPSTSITNNHEGAGMELTTPEWFCEHSAFTTFSFSTNVKNLETFMFKGGFDNPCL